MLKHLLLAAVVVAGFSSCVNTRKATYFNDLKNSTHADKLYDPPIQVNDQLSIIVTSLNPEATEVFNRPNQSVISQSSGTGVSSITTGYLVDQNGAIAFPMIGSITAAGLTLDQLARKLENELSSRKLLVEPMVNIRLMNFRVTVLGEVNRPTVVTSTTGRLTFLEALGMAGDLTILSKRENVLLIRTENGQKIVQRIDLTSPDFVASSPYYHLRSNDVIYVEPNKLRVANASVLRQNLPAILSGLSFLAIVVDRITRN